MNNKNILILGDAGYDSKKNRRVAKQKKLKPVIAKNPRRTKKKFRLPKILKKKRYIIEQTNSILKEMLQKSWQNFRGIEKKTSIVYSALIGMNLIAIDSLITGTGLREVSRYWY